MRRGRIFIYLALILVIGLLVAYLAYMRLIGPTQTGGGVATVPTATPIPTVNVVMVTQHISRGDTLTDSVVGLVPYQEDLVIEGMFRRVEDVVGKIARLDLDPGFILTQNMVTTDKEGLGTVGGDAALLIPRGMVAVSIPISRLSSVSYAPQRGDHVNVIVTLLFVELDPDFQSRLPNLSGQVIGPSVGMTEGEPSISSRVGSVGGPHGRAETDPGFDSPFYFVPSETQRPRMVSQTLIQDVIVLQMGEFELPNALQPTAVPPANQPTPTPGARTTPTAPPPPPEVITLIVTPQDAVTLNYLLYSGSKLTLALRGAKDDTRVQTEAVTLQFLLDSYKIPVPAKLPYGLEPRVDAIAVPTQSVETTPTPVP